MKFATLVVIAFVAFVAWAGSPVSLAGDGRNHFLGQRIRSRPRPARPTATLSTVNGNVRVGRGATADHAKTVNGEIEVEEQRQDSAKWSTVNGSLDIGEDVAIAAQCFDGQWRRRARQAHARRRRRVDGVTARSRSMAREVGGQIVTRNGDIDLTDGARVRGGIHVKKNNGSNWGWGKDEPLKVHICSTCVVDGELRFDRPVELRVDDGAKIGKVIGDNGHAPLNRLTGCGRTAAPRARRGASQTCARSASLTFPARGSMRCCPAKPRR